MRTRILACLVVLFLVGCSWIVEDTRTPEEIAAVQTARAETPPLPTVEPEVVPEEEVGEVVPDPTPVPPCLVIKVNISTNGTFIYHMPDGAYYDQVKIDESRGEFFACSEEEAQAAGARKSSR